MTLAEKIKKLRKEKGWSQEKLAQKLGIHRKTVAFYELNKSYPTAENIQKIANVFDIASDYLLSDEVDSFASLGIKDKSLVPIFEQIDKLDEKSKDVIKIMVESLSLRLQIKEMANK